MNRLILAFAFFALTVTSIDAQTKKKTTTKKTPVKSTSKTTTSSSSGSSNTSSTGSSTIDGIISTVGGMINSGTQTASSMTNDLAAKGLKEALSHSTQLATNKLGITDGFLGNAVVKILMPPEAKKLESTLRSLGMGSVCDQIITSLNRSAEAAVVEAAPIFLAAITQMTITDAINILTGGPTAATDYLKRTSGQALMQKISPIIQSNLEKTQATKYWSDAMNQYNRIPMVQKVNPDLNAYVTQKASDGVFMMVAEEEAKIRTNPGQRLGSVIQDVFGWADKNKK